MLMERKFHKRGAGCLTSVLILPAGGASGRMLTIGKLQDKRAARIATLLKLIFSLTMHVAQKLFPSC
jgi:hypothetical protein